MRARGFSLLELMIVLTMISGLSALAIPNLIRAKMAANEAASISMIKNIGTSQELYRRTDWDANGVKEYAQNIGTKGGQGNGESLFFNVRTDVPTGLLDTAIVNAEIPVSGNYSNTTPRNGYIFFMQTGATYPTVFSYVSGTSMTKGYGICAVPHQYSLSGISTYQMDSSGVVYAKDQGDNSLMAAYNVNPVNKWYPTQ